MTAGVPPPFQPREIRFAAAALRDIKKLSPDVAARVLGALERYAMTRQGDVRKLAGVDPTEYRLRVGDWRVRFAQDAAFVTVLHVRHRRTAY